MQQRDLRYYWHADRCDPRIASVRLRLLQPVAFLQSTGVSVDTSDVAFDPSRHDVVLFCKSVSEGALEIALRAKAAGKFIVYDICDNVFAGKDNKKTARRSAAVRQMLALADHVTFTTEVLRQQILEQVPYDIGKTSVIADCLDCFEQGGSGRSVQSLRAYHRTANFLRRNEGALHCIWFGKSQGKKSGLAHLQAAVRYLEGFSKRFPVTLTILSNRPFRYWLYSRSWKIPHHYEAWDLNNFGDILAMHDVTVIPLEQNEYTLGKTINRPATAIMAGLGVIADSIPAYEELRPYIPLDDWSAQLERYWNCAPSGDPQLAQARLYLESRYGKEQLGRQWLELLSMPSSMAAGGRAAEEVQPRDLPL